MQKGPIHTAHRLTSPQKVEAIENLPHIFIDSFQTCLEKKLLRFKSVDNHAYSWQYCCTNIKYTKMKLENQSDDTWNTGF